MSKKKRFPGIVCAALGHDYQVFSDERYVYIVRLGRSGAGDYDQAIASPDEFTPILGNVRLVRTEIQLVRCTLVRRRTVIAIQHGEETARLHAHEALTEEQILDVFGGLPLHMSLEKRSIMPVQGNWLEIGMFFAVFVLALLGIACRETDGLRSAAKWLSLGWMLTPAIWLVLAGRRRKFSAATKTPFALGIGAMASLFACVFLWLAPGCRPLDWSETFLPAAVVVVVAVLLYTAARQKFEPLIMLAVAVLTLVGYAPGTVLCLNELPSPRSQETEQVSVVELTGRYDRGDYAYYAVVESNGVQSCYQVSREEYDALTEGGAAQVVHTTGALGIRYVDVLCE